MLDTLLRTSAEIVPLGPVDRRVLRDRRGPVHSVRRDCTAGSPAGFRSRTAGRPLPDFPGSARHVSLGEAQVRSFLFHHLQSGRPPACPRETMLLHTQNARERSIIPSSILSHSTAYSWNRSWACTNPSRSKERSYGGPRLMASWPPRTTWTGTAPDCDTLSSAAFYQPRPKPATPANATARVRHWITSASPLRVVRGMEEPVTGQRLAGLPRRSFPYAAGDSPCTRLPPFWPHSVTTEPPVRYSLAHTYSGTDCRGGSPPCAQRSATTPVTPCARSNRLGGGRGGVRVGRQTSRTIVAAEADLAF